MTQDELSVTLKDMGRAMGMCDKFYDRWVDGMDVDTLLDMYLRGLDFCVEKDFPPLDFIRRNFGVDDLHRHHIYLDEEVHLEGVSGDYIFLGHCTGCIRFRDFCISGVYLRHTSDLKIRCDGLSRVFITIYECASCDARGADPLNMHVYDRRKRKEG